MIVNPGATFILDNTGTNNLNRLNDAATLTLSGGTFNYLGATGAASTETIGGLTVNPGNSTIQTTAGTGGSTILTFASLTRAAGGMLTFAAGNGQTLGSTTNEILFTTTPTLSVSVIKGAVTNDAAAGTINLASYGASGIVALASYTAFTGTTTDNGQNILITNAATLTASTTPNAVLIRGDGVSVSGAFTMTPTTSEVVAVDTGNTGNNLASTTALAFGATEGVLYTANTGGSTGAFTISSVLSDTVAAGSVALTVAGGGTLTLSAANAETGNVDLDSGNLVLGSSSVVVAASITNGPIGTGHAERLWRHDLSRRKRWQHHRQ